MLEITKQEARLDGKIDPQKILPLTMFPTFCACINFLKWCSFLHFKQLFSSQAPAKSLSQAPLRVGEAMQETVAPLEKETAEMVAGKTQGWRNDENLLEFLVILVMRM